MSIQLIVKAGSYPDFVTDLDTLPTSKAFEQNQGMKSLLGLGIVLVILLFFIGVEVLYVALASVIALYFSRGSSWLTDPNTITYERKYVSVREFSLLKKDLVWREPYGAFEGVFLSKESEKDASGRNIYYVSIELQHSDPEKTLPLFAKRTTKGNKTRQMAEAKKCLKHYAHLFNLPAFD